MEEWQIALLGGASASALISTVGNIILHFLQRKERREEKQSGHQKQMQDKLNAIGKGVMLLELDKIKYLGLRFIRDGGITYEDRALLHKMHDNYHKELGGNGDLDQIMEEVDELPLVPTVKKI